MSFLRRSDVSVTSNSTDGLRPPTAGRTSSFGGPTPPPRRGPSPAGQRRPPSPSMRSRGSRAGSGETPPSRRSSPSPKRTMTNVEEYGGSSWAEVSMPAKQRSFRGLTSRSPSPSMRANGDGSLASSIAKSITDGQVDDDDALLDGFGSGSDREGNVEDDKQSMISESTYGGYSAAGVRTGGYSDTFDQSANMLPQPKGRRRPGQSLVIQHRDQHQFERSYGSIDSASRGGGGGAGSRSGSTAPPPTRQRDADNNAKSTLNMLKQNQKQRGVFRQRDDSSADRAAGSATANYNDDAADGNGNVDDGDGDEEDSIDDDHDDGIYGQHTKQSNDDGVASGGLTELQLHAAGLGGTQDAEDSEYSGTTFTRSEDFNSQVKDSTDAGTIPSVSVSETPINFSSPRKKYASSVRSWKSGKSAASSSSWLSQSQISDHVSDPSDGSSSEDEEDGNGDKAKRHDYGEEGSIPSDGSSVKSGSELQNMFHKPNTNNAAQRDGSVVHLSQNSRWNEQSTRSGSLAFKGGPQTNAGVHRQGSHGSTLDNLTDAGKDKTFSRRMSESNANATFNNKAVAGRTAAGGAASSQRRHGSLGLGSGLVTTRQEAAASAAGSSRLSTIESLSQKSGPNETNSKSTASSSIPTTSSESQISYAASEQTASTVATSVTDYTASTRPSLQSGDASKSSFRSEGSYSRDSRSRDDDYSQDFSRREDDDRSQGSGSRSAYSSHSEGSRSNWTEDDRTRDTKSTLDTKDHNVSTVHSISDSKTSASVSASEMQSSAASSSYKDHSMDRSSMDDGSSGSSHSRDSRILDHNDNDDDQYEDDDDQDMTTPSSIASSRYAAQQRGGGQNDDEQTQETTDTAERKSRAAYRAYAEKLRGNMQDHRADSSHSIVSSVLSDLPDVPPREQGLVPGEEEEKEEKHQATTYNNKAKSETASSALGSEVSGDMSMFDNSTKSYGDGDRSAMMMNSGLESSGRSFATEMTDASGDASKFPEQPIMSQKEELEFQRRKNDLERQRQLILDAAAATGVTVNSKRESLSSRSNAESSATSASESANGSKDQEAENCDAITASAKSSAAAAAITSSAAIGGATTPTRERLKPNNPYSEVNDGGDGEEVTSPTPTAASLLTAGNTVKKEPLIIDHDRKKTMLQSLTDLQRLQRVVSDLTIPADLDSMRSGLSYTPSMMFEDEPSALDGGSALGHMGQIAERGESSLHSEEASASLNTETDVSSSETSGANVKHRINDELAACKRLLDSNPNSLAGSSPSDKLLNSSNSTPGAVDTDAESSSFSGDDDYKNKAAARRKNARDGDAAAGSPLHDTDEQEDQESDTGWTSSDSSSNQRERNHVASKMASIGKSKNGAASENTPLAVASVSVPASLGSNTDDLDVGFPSEEKRMANASYDDDEDDHETPSMNSKATPSTTAAAVSPMMSSAASANQSVSTADSSYIHARPYEEESVQSREKSFTSRSSASQSTYSQSQSQSEQSSGQRRPLRGSGGASTSSSESESTYPARDQSEAQRSRKAEQLQQYGFADAGVVTSSHYSDDDETASHESGLEDAVLGPAPEQQDPQTRRDFMKDFSRRFDADGVEFDEIDDVEVGLTGNKGLGPTTLGNPGDDDSTYDKSKRNERKKQQRGEFCRAFTTPWWKPVVLGVLSVLLIGGIVATIVVLTMNGGDAGDGSVVNTQSTDSKGEGGFNPGAGLPGDVSIVTQTGDGSGPVLPSAFASLKWDVVGDFDSPSLSQAADGAGSSVALSSDGLRLAVGSKFWDSDILDAGLVTVYDTAQDSDADGVIVAQAIGHSASENLGTAVSINQDGTVLAIGSLMTSITEGGDALVTGYNVTIYSISGEQGSATASRRLQPADVALVSIPEEPAITSAISEQMNVEEFGLVPIGQSLIAELGDFSILLEDHATPGLSLSLSGAGDRVAIGVPHYFGTGDVFVYERNLLDAAETAWQQMDITSNLLSRASGDDMYGASVRLSGDGQVLAAGAASRGAGGRGIIFKLLQADEGAPAMWDTDAFFTSSDIGMENSNVVDLSQTIALNYNGSMVAIGAPASNSQGGSDKSGFVAILKRLYAEENEGDSRWAQVGQTITGVDVNEYMGHSLAFSSEGTRLAVGAPGRKDNDQALGATLLFELASKESDSNANMMWDRSPPLYGHGLGSGAGYSVSMSADGAQVASGLPYISNCTSIIEGACEEHGTAQLYRDPSIATGNFSVKLPSSESAVATKPASFPSCLLLPLNCDACKALIENERSDLRAEIIFVDTSNLRGRHLEEDKSSPRITGVVQIQCSSNNAVVEDPKYEV